LADQPPVLGPGTRVGEHTWAILAGLGFDDSEIHRLHAAGVVASPGG
jgi:crotonobetainyl-CoA:carnitine CoA-transferase CaiB-like acyl-CoA transferase